MRKAYLMLLVVFLAFNVQAQNQEHKEYYENDILKVEGFKDENGKKTGEWKYYYQDGQLKSIGKHSAKAKFGNSSSKIGEWITYYNNGQIESIAYYSNPGGRKKGEWKTFHQNGQLKEIGNYLDGQSIGEWKNYHENGQLKETGSRKGIQRIGEWKTYYNNGQIRSIGNYLDGGKSGEWKYYNKNGSEEIPITEAILLQKQIVQDVEVPFSGVQNVPIYPGCEKGNNSEKKDCTSKKITAFVDENFNTALADDLGLKGRQRITVIFKIDIEGHIVDVRARAPHPKLEQEAVRVINLLPKIKPGKHKGKVVIVTYALPIMFQVQE